MDRKKPSDVTPEQQERLDRMSTTGLIQELQKKYGLTKVAVNTALKIPEDSQMGTETLVDLLNKKRDRLLLELSKLPVHHEIYSRQELMSIVKVNKRLLGFIEDFNLTTKYFSKGSPEYKKQCDRYIERVIEYLDSENFWAYKFTTENAGGAPSSEPLSFDIDDSLYYTTQTGISLRLKRSISDRGLDDVIQPFYETITFVLPDSSLMVAKPMVGAHVREYRSEEFRTILNIGQIEEDFESPNEIYLKDGKIFFVNSNLGPHEGDRVNKILKTR